MHQLRDMSDLETLFEHDRDQTDRLSSGSRELTYFDHIDSVESGVASVRFPLLSETSSPAQPMPGW